MKGISPDQMLVVCHACDASIKRKGTRSSVRGIKSSHDLETFDVFLTRVTNRGWSYTDASASCPDHLEVKAPVMWDDVAAAAWDATEPGLCGVDHAALEDTEVDIEIVPWECVCCGSVIAMPADYTYPPAPCIDCLSHHHEWQRLGEPQ